MHFIDSGAPYALFEHVDGFDLGSLRSPLPWPVVVHLTRQLAGAIGAVHDAGLIHRDIKPGNVMVSRACRLTLIDFGLAKLAPGDEWDDEDVVAASTCGDLDDDLTAPGSVAGTPRYQAPEVRQGEPATIASDLFSFGLVLHQMLTGRSPSIETSASDLDDLDAPRLLRDLVARCLERDPAGRPQRASAASVILDALDAQPGVIVRVCMGAAAAGRSVAVATTRFVGVGPADATVPTDAAAPVVARVDSLPDHHMRVDALPARYPRSAARRSTRCSVAPSLPWRESTWLPTLAYPKRSRQLADAAAGVSTVVDPPNPACRLESQWAGPCTTRQHDEPAMDSQSVLGWPR